jgi:hypothetical protein
VSDVSDQFADGPDDGPGDVSDDVPGDVPDDISDELADIEQAMADARSRLLDVPAEVVVTNHVMGLYELAAIHLSADPPNLAAASLAIDAVGCLVDGLGDRLGDDATTMRDALANIRLAYVSLAQRP